MESKVILNRESTASKTSIVTSLSSESFDPDFRVTVGAVYSTDLITIKRKQIQLHIWDRVNQEKFHNLASMYFRGIVCYDSIMQYELESSRVSRKFGKFDGYTYMFCLKITKLRNITSFI
jgi:hypothetical protein